MSTPMHDGGPGTLSSPFAPAGPAAEDAWAPAAEEAWQPDEHPESEAWTPEAAAEDELFEAEEYVRHSDYLAEGEDETGEDEPTGDDEAAGEIAGWEAESVLGALGDLADRVRSLLRQGQATAAVGMMIASGTRDENPLTNIVFHARHPELGGRSIRREERALADEWIAIRDQLIRPLLSAGAGSAPRAGDGARRRRLSTAQIQRAWHSYRGAEHRMVRLPLWGLHWHTKANPETVTAWRALEQALTVTGYQPHRYWAFIDRNIKGTTTKSLHAYGLAMDIDHTEPKCNVNRRKRTPVRFSDAPTKEERCRDVRANRADTSFTRDQVEAVLAIRTVDGHQVFSWGGYWTTTKDTMHFEINVTPQELARGIRPDSVATGASAVP